MSCGKKLCRKRVLWRGKDEDGEKWRFNIRGLGAYTYGPIGILI